MKRISNSQYFKATYAGMQDDFDQPYAGLEDCECDDLRAKLEDAEKETLRLKDGLKLFIKYPPQADQIVYMLTALLHDYRG